ncbi:Inactive glutathione S-transferase D3 [Diplonema papillatum]|nr:Inactive glutathione S-transferase D3 [Diplonema papillatum]
MAQNGKTQENPISYITRKQVPELVDGLMLKLVDARPEDPRAFLAAMLAGNPVPSETAGKVQLFLARLSPNCHGPWLVLRMAGIEHELRDVDLGQGEQMKPDFLSMNPTHTVPLIRDADGTCVWEGNAIMRYLCSKYAPALKFYPSDVCLRAHCEMALDWRQTTLYPTVMQVCFTALGFRTIPQEEIDAATEKLLAPNDGPLAVLESYFLAGKPYICGDQISIADFSVFSALTFLDGMPSVEIPSSIRLYRTRCATATEYEEVLNGAGGFGLSQYLTMRANQSS